MHFKPQGSSAVAKANIDNPLVLLLPTYLSVIWMCGILIPADTSHCGILVPEEQ